MAIYTAGLFEWVHCPHRTADGRHYPDDMVVRLRETTDEAKGLYLHLCADCADIVRSAVYGDVIQRAVNQAAKETFKALISASAE